MSQKALRERWKREPGRTIAETISEWFLSEAKRLFQEGSMKAGHLDLPGLLRAVDHTDEVEGWRDLRGIVLEGGIAGFDFRGFDFSFARLTFNFTSCRLDGSKFDESVLRGMISGRAVGLSFRRADLRGAGFARADLTDGTFQGAKLSGCSFEEANLARADLSKTICTGTNFFGADLRGARFCGGLLEEAVLQNALIDESTDLSGAILRNVYDTDRRNHAGELIGRGIDWRVARHDESTVYEKNPQ